MSSILNYKVDKHVTPFHGKNFSHSVFTHQIQKPGWMGRVIERVIAADAKGLVYKVIVKSLAIFALLVLGFSGIGFPIALWGGFEYMRQTYEKKMRTERNERSKACADHVKDLCSNIENARPQLIKYLRLSEIEATKFEATALLRQAIAIDPNYLDRHPLT